MIELTNIEKGYIAGIIDGEGCLGIYLSINKNQNSTYARRIAVFNTCFALIKYLKTLLGGHIYIRHPKGNRKISYEWRMEYRKSEEILKQILPYLKVKQKQAKILIEFNKTLVIKKKLGMSKKVKAKKKFLYKQIRKLNQKGKTSV